MAGIGSVALAACPIVALTSAHDPVTVRGTLHNVFGSYSHLIASMEFLMVPPAFWECPRWRPFTVPAAFAAALVAGIYVTIHFLDVFHGGIGQRLWVGTTAVCSLVVAWRLARNPIT